MNRTTEEVARAIGKVIGRLLSSYLIVCFYLWLISICFGIAYSWPRATGVWLIVGLLRKVFR